MKPAKIIFGIVEIALVVLIALLVLRTAQDLSSMSYDFGYRVFTEKPMANAPGRDVLVQITPDQTHYEIAQLLEEKGLCRDSKLFYIQIELSAYRKKIDGGGSFTLNTSMTPKEMIVILAGEELPTEEEE